METVELRGNMKGQASCKGKEVRRGMRVLQGIDSSY